MKYEYAKNSTQHVQHVQHVAPLLHGQSATLATHPFRGCCMLQPEKRVALLECVIFCG